MWEGTRQQKGSNKGANEGQTRGGKEGATMEGAREGTPLDVVSAYLSVRNLGTLAIQRWSLHSSARGSAFNAGSFYNSYNSQEPEM